MKHTSVEDPNALDAEQYIESILKGGSDDGDNLPGNFDSSTKQDHRKNIENSTRTLSEKLPNTSSESFVVPDREAWLYVKQEPQKPFNTSRKLNTLSYLYIIFKVCAGSTLAILAIVHTVIKPWLTKLSSMRKEYLTFVLSALNEFRNLKLVNLEINEDRYSSLEFDKAQQNLAALPFNLSNERLQQLFEKLQVIQHRDRLISKAFAAIDELYQQNSILDFEASRQSIQSLRRLLAEASDQK